MSGLQSCKQEIPGIREYQNITVVLDWVPNTNHTGIYIARGNGYYDDEGLEGRDNSTFRGRKCRPYRCRERGIRYQLSGTGYICQDSKDPLPVVAIAAIIQHNTSGFASPADKGYKDSC